MVSGDTCTYIISIDRCRVRGQRLFVNNYSCTRVYEEDVHTIASSLYYLIGQGILQIEKRMTYIYIFFNFIGKEFKLEKQN